jgi:putative DNA primase/helicase
MGANNTFERKPVDVEEERQRNAMRNVWAKSRPIADISPAANYLRVRLGASAPPLQFVREVDGAFHSADQAAHPAMVAKVVGWNDLAVNIHLTYLTRDGRKASVAPAKKVMPGKLPDGCAIRLMPASEIMGVSEGIETALSASLMFDIPVWACVNGSLLAKWKPPEVAHEIVVFGDNDTNYTGQAKAYELANRLEVQFKRRVKVMIPQKVGTDWNDFYLARDESERRY